MEPYLYISLSGIAGLVVGMGGMIAYSKAGLNKNQQNAERILNCLLYTSPSPRDS